MHSLRRARHDLARDIERGLPGLRRSGHACGRTLRGLSWTGRDAPPGPRARRAAARHGHGQPASDSRGGPRGALRRSPRRSRRDRAGSRRSALHAEGRQPVRRGPTLDGRGGPRLSDPGPWRRRSDRPRDPARNAGWANLPDPRSGGATAGRRRLRRSVCNHAGGDPARSRSADAGDVPGACADPASPHRDRQGGERARMTDRSRPLYMIGVVAEMVKIHPQTLRMYEKKGLIRPSRTEGKTRMYSAEDVEDIARVTRLARDLGVNLAGIEIILKMRRRMLDMQAQIEELTNHVRSDMTQSRDEAQRGKSEALVRAATSQLSPVDLF